MTVMGMATEAQFHVLAVDDSLVDRKLIERLLKTSSYQVTTVDSGLKALEFLGLQEEEEDERRHTNPNQNPASIASDHHQEIEVNLIITDYCMPGMTGYDLLKKIKKSSSLKDIPVVIMSSENVPSRISRCLEEGAEEFFLKPVQLADVNRLKPHIIKRKTKEQPQQPQSPLLLQQPVQQQQQQLVLPQQPLQQQQLQQQLQQQQQQQPNNNKRKAMEEALSPERTRPRFNSGLTTVV